MALKRDLERCPSGITRNKRQWHASLIAPTGVITKSFSDLDSAIEWFSDGKDQIRKGTWMDPDLMGTSLKEFSEEWVSKKVEISGKTLATYSSQLKTHILPTFGSRMLTSITNQEIRGWVSNKLDEGVGHTTLRQSLRLIRAIFEDAVDSGLCSRNPTKGVGVAKKTRKKAKALTLYQVRDLANSCEKYGPLIEFLAGTGLRVNEALALKKGDVDLDSKRLHVVRAWTTNASGKKVMGDTKNREERSLALSAPMTEILKPLLEAKGSEDFIFTGANGDALDYGYFRRAYFDKAPKMLNLVGVTIHWLRHTCASMLIRLGAPVTTISEILGHSSIKITLDTYSHWYEGNSANWLEKLGQTFSDPAP